MSNLSSSFKVCQTCVYWNGRRQINGLTKMVDAESTTGKCANPQGFFNLNMSNLQTCKGYTPVV